MGAFVITKRFDGYYKYVFTSKKGKTIFTSSKFELKEDCENGIEVLKSILESEFFIIFKNTKGLYFFKIILNDKILAISRKFTTELRLQKGIKEVIRFGPLAEMLDFTVEDNIFLDV